jgi:ubiquinone/menaquinone biosynthesis C-methylase UbiE
VPVFNEETRVAESGAELAQFVARCGPGSELIFVDDGSTDGTAGVVEELARWSPAPVRLLRRPHLGKGAAVQAGLEMAAAEYAGFTDVDLSTPVDQLAAVFKAAQMAPVVAVGSRDAPASLLVRPQQWPRELLGKSYNRLAQVTVVPGVADTQCGAKIAHRTIWTAILPWCEEKGFAWDVEALAVARRLDVPVREVAIEWSNDERSRVRIVRDGADMVLALRRIWRRTRAVPSARGAVGVFTDTQATTLMESDSQHWWFQSKAALANSVLRRHLPPRLRDSRLVDVGAGAGGVTAAMGWRSDRVCAVEGSETLCRHGRDRHTLFTVVGLADRLPLGDRTVGVVTALDVIEHFEHPELVLEEAHRVLVDDGLLVVNVPAHQWLWSGADELLGHVRRYTRPLLREQVELAGFEVLCMSHVFSWLVAPVWVQRRLTRDPRRQLGLEATSPLIDRAAMVLTALEREVVGRASLPFGTSILAVMAKAAPR